MVIATTPKTRNRNAEPGGIVLQRCPNCRGPQTDGCDDNGNTVRRCLSCGRSRITRAVDPHDAAVDLPPPPEVSRPMNSHAAPSPPMNNHQAPAGAPTLPPLAPHTHDIPGSIHTAALAQAALSAAAQHTSAGDWQAIVREQIAACLRAAALADAARAEAARLVAALRAYGAADIPALPWATATKAERRAWGAHERVVCSRCGAEHYRDTMRKAADGTFVCGAANRIACDKRAGAAAEQIGA